MRASISAAAVLKLIGVSAILVACTTRTIVRQDPGSDPSSPSDPSSDTDGTDPAAPPVDPTNPEKPASPIVTNIAVSGVAVFQAVKVDVVKDGKLVAASARKAPVVAKRQGLIRVYVAPGADWTPQDVTAEVRLVAEDQKFPILRVTKNVTVASKDEDAKTCFDIEVPAENLVAGVTFQVALTSDSGSGAEKIKEGEESTGRFPADGSFSSLGAEVSGKLKVVVVPIKYDTDGSGRTPDVSAAQIERYKRTLMGVYPASEVEVTTHAPYPWTTTIASNGSGFSTVLRAMHQLRQRDGVPRDVYYYGLLQPSASLSTFCSGSCVLGLSPVVDEDTAVMRASVGLGFTGQSAANTMAHEVGHAHGREHAPCGGPAGVDQDYPYPQAQIGVWGYNIFTKAFIAPTKGRDMMGYCPNEWISDYTYGALFERISAISMDKQIAGGGAQTQKYAIATVDAAGELSWDGGSVNDTVEASELEMRGGTLTTAHFVADNGAEMATKAARFVKFDHLPGGFVFVPQESAIAWKSLKIDGYKKALVRQ